MKKLFLLAMILGMIPFVQAQDNGSDKIYLKDKTVIECKIVEIGTNEVKYYPIGEENGPLYSIENIRIEKLVMASGKEISYAELNNGAVNYTSLEDQKRNAIKLNMLSWINTNLSFSYERSLKPGRSIETGLGFIGVGTDAMDRNPSGVFLNFGYKFFRSPDWYIQGMKYGHVLNGIYFKPEVSLSLYEHNSGYYDPFAPSSNERQSVVAVAVLAVIGRQWVFDDFLLLDIYGGIGYGTSNGNSFEYVSNYAFSGGFDDVPLAWKTGMKIGILIK